MARAVMRANGLTFSYQGVVVNILHPEPIVLGGKGAKIRRNRCPSLIIKLSCYRCSRRSLTVREPPLSEVRTRIAAAEGLTAEDMREMLCRVA